MSSVAPQISQVPASAASASPAVAERAGGASLLLQVPVLVAGAWLLRPVPLTGDLKFVVLALIAIVGSFAVANVLKRVALIRRFV